MGFAQNDLKCDIILGQSPKTNITFVMDFLNKFEIDYILRKLKLNVNMAKVFFQTRHKGCNFEVQNNCWLQRLTQN